MFWVDNRLLEDSKHRATFQCALPLANEDENLTARTRSEHFRRPRNKNIYPCQYTQLEWVVFGLVFEICARYACVQ